MTSGIQAVFAYYLIIAGFALMQVYDDWVKLGTGLMFLGVSVLAIASGIVGPDVAQ